MSTVSNFQYFTNRRNSVFVASFVGELCSEAVSILNACNKEVQEAEGLKVVVLNLQGLTNITEDGIRPFAQFQLLLRERFSLCLCSIHGHLEKVLFDYGVIRKTEVFPDLLKALQSIMNQNQGGP